jgi:hypothetical protein
MSDQTGRGAATSHRTDPLAASPRHTLWLVGTKYLFWVLFLVIYLMLTVNSYTRSVFRPLPGEADQARRDCLAAPGCGAAKQHLVSTQETLLTAVTAVVRATAWVVLVVDAGVLVLATALLLAPLWRQRQTVPVRPGVQRLVASLWWVQAIIVAALLVAYLGLLLAGAVLLRQLPDAAQFTTFRVAFTSPFFDVGTAYYLVWFIGMNTMSILHNRAIGRRFARATAPALS